MFLCKLDTCEIYIEIEEELMICFLDRNTLCKLWKPDVVETVQANGRHELTYYYEIT